MSPLIVESDCAIVAEKLVKRYGRIEALKDVSLSIPRGQIFGLLGANGAGKTTLLRTMVGLSGRATAISPYSVSIPNNSRARRVN